ncbi:MAG: radical SAM protein [Nanoarchaeota archaeon]
MKAVLNSFRAKEGHCPHGLGIQSISKYCNERGHEVEMVSSRVENISESIEKILALNPQVVGLSSNYITEEYISKMARIIKQRNGEIFVVVGGPSVTYSFKESPIRHSDADLFVRGDGEEAFYEILEKGPDSFLTGRNKLTGVSTKQDFNEGIASVDLKLISSVFPITFQTDHVYWETVRGCAFNCIYCAHPGQKNQFREVPLEKVTKEVEHLESKGFRAIYITDPILGGKKERSKKIIGLLGRLKSSFITAEYRPEYLDEEVLDLLEDAQIGWLEFGLQTTNPSLEYFRRNAPSVMEKLERLSKRLIKYSLDLIVGIPGDTKESFESSLKFAIERAKPTSLKVFPLRVYEGTQLHHMVKIEGWEYDDKTRIIKRSNSFDETEFSNWMKMGRTSAHLYRFLESNNWFGEESKLRDIKMFIRFSDKFGKQIKEEYDDSQIKKLWSEFRNER